MSIENHVSFMEGRPIQCHELCEMVFDQLSRLEDPDLRSKLKKEMAVINDILLKMQSVSSQGKDISGTDVIAVLEKFDSLVKEIDEVPRGSAINRYELEVIRQYPADIWRTYVLNMSIS